MKKDIIIRLSKRFEERAQIHEEWRSFCKVIDKAKIACQKSGQPSTDHFVGVNKMIGLGKGEQREIADIILSRYARYLIAQNDDSFKEPIARKE